MRKNFILLLLLTVAFSPVINAQTYSLNWNTSFSPAWPNGSVGPRTATNVETSGINVGVTMVNSAAASTYQNNTPAVGNPGSIGWTLPNPTGTGSMVLWTDWANTAQRVTTTITFTAPVANPSFYVGDIDKSDATIGPNDNYLDRITVSGTTPGGSTLNAVASKFNAASTVIIVSSGSAWANPTTGQGANAPTNATTGAAQDGTALFTVTGTVSSVTIVWDNFNNNVAGVNPTGQAVNIGDINFTKTVPITGTVYNDVNGDMTKQAGETGIEPTPLFVNVVDVTTGIVIGVAEVNADGTYSVPNVASNSNVNIILSTVAGTLGSTPPATASIAGYANTSTLTISSAATGTAGLATQNFGLDQLPVPATSSIANQVNPGGINNTTVPAGSFSATDPDGGTITSIRITAFPDNATSITINGNIYYSGTFPVGGVSVPTNTTGQPTQNISVDPVDGIVNVVIPYRATDNAGKESTASGSVTVPYLSVLPVKLTNFSGSISNGYVTLVWKTNNEININSYAIERSSDGTSFTKAGEVPARNLTAEQQYQYSDPANSATSYYRIRVTDRDSRITYSPVIRISNNVKNNDISNLVNPFHDKISFQYNSVTTQLVTFNLIDASGKTMKTIKQTVTAGANIIIITGIENLSRGNYFLRIISSDNSVQTSSLFKN